MFDPDQYSAICSDPCTPLLILAHAGTGKTRTLVERLILLKRAQQAGRFGERGAGTIVALTFTRNAARELRERLAARRGDDDLAGYDVRTFHALGWELYRGGWARDYDNRPLVQVATYAQALQAACDAARRTGLDVAPLLALRLIAEAKLGLPVRATDPTHIHAALTFHDDLLARRGLIHVHDMLVRPVTLLGLMPALRDEVRRRVACVVADEAQDWSPYQAALFAYLAGPEGYATACGDPNQAIFSGGTPRFILEYPAAYPHARVVTLRTTYRLTGPVFALSRAIAAHIPGGAVSGRPNRPAGSLPMVHLARTRAGEATWIAAYLSELRSYGALQRWSDAVVLVRTHRQQRRLAAALRTAGLSRVRAGVQTLDQRPAVRALLAWLRLLRDPDDSAALLVALGGPPRGAQHSAPRSLHDVLATSGPWTIARLMREAPANISDWQRRDLGAAIRLYNGLRVLAETVPPLVLLDALLQRTGLAERLHAQAHDAQEDVAALRRLVAREGDVGVLEHMLAEETAANGEDALTVQTIHGFKGNEARVVVVSGVEEGWLPHPAALRDGATGWEEELRTFYVACTRALDHEAITASWEPDDEQRPGGPSRLFHLISPRLVNIA